MAYRYHPAVLDELLRHGLRPTARTAPERVHEWVSDLYRYELRRLRGRLLNGEVRKQDYFARVVDLRRQYPIVSLKPAQLIEGETGPAVEGGADGIMGMSRR